MPPAAPDYSSLVVAAERQPTPSLPSDSHIVSCNSGAVCHSEKIGGGGGTVCWKETKTAARCLFNLSPTDEHVKKSYLINRRGEKPHQKVYITLKLTVMMD